MHYFITNNDEVCLQSSCYSATCVCRLKTKSRANEIHGTRQIRYLGYHEVS
jgi:hypothetical protein